MSIIAKYKFDKSIYADLLPEFNSEFTSDKYNTTDEEVDGIITRTIESDELPTLMRFGRLWVDGESATDNRTDSLLEILDMNTNGLTDCDNMFRYCKNLTSITCEWDTSNIINMYSMFNNCNNLTSLDVSNWNTSKVTNMYAMFHNCNNLTSLNISNFNTSNVTRMDYIFFNCHKLTSLDVSNFNTSNVTRMDYMFANCTNLVTLDVSNFDTSKVTNMEGMFNHCYNLVSLDVNNFDTSKVTNMAHMFDNCNKLTTLDVGNFNTNDVTTMYAMFSAANKLISLDISNFNISDTTNIDYILSNTSLLTDIGMLYCDQSTINKVASSLPTDTTQVIWVEDVDIKDLTPVEGVEFKQYAKDTEIMLTSPLLEGDKLVVKDGKLYHYHKMGMVVLDGSEDESWGINSTKTISYYTHSSIPNNTKIICNILPTRLIGDIYNDGLAGIGSTNTNEYKFGIGTMGMTTANEIRQWLQVNPITVVYELASPYYELISEDPLTISLIAESSDITNSSNIPLNMTINNKGLSTVAMSPSTTYTVAFDKEGEGDLTVNLCGNEVTTSNNVVEITTSSELGNNELIFYGDGVEVSNVRLLEGSVSGDSIPRESFKGLKNSFEDGYIENMINDNRYRCVLRLTYPNGTTPFEEMYPLAEGNRVRSDLLKVKSNTTYTVHTPGYIVAVHEYNSNKIWIKDHLWRNTDTYTFSTMSDCTGLVIYIKKSDNKVFTEDEANSVSMILLEEKDFNHLDKYKVEYKVTGKNKYNKDKYPFGDGYSLSNSSTDVEGFDEVTSRSEMFKLLPNTTYTCSADLTLDSNVGSAELFVLLYDSFRERVIINRTETISTGRYSVTFTTDSVRTYCELRFDNNFSKTGNEGIVTIDNIQLEEGSTATPYEPYKEYTKTFYLNSPLLEGDTIEDINGVATHVKRYEKVVLDGRLTFLISAGGWENKTDVCTFEYFKPTPTAVLDSTRTLYADTIPTYNFIEQWNYSGTTGIEGLSTHINGGFVLSIKRSKLKSQDIYGLDEYLKKNPITVVYELASPIYEPISTESILCDSYVNGHLDVDTNIPIEKVVFKSNEIPCRYSYPNTSYIVQFESDNVGLLDLLHWAGKSLNNIPVIKGINKVNISSHDGDTGSNGYFALRGIGFNASNIQVVATDRNVDFGYFKGLQSSFESELVTDENDENYGKYKVECKIVGKNKFDLSKLPTSLEPINNGFRYDTSKGTISVLDMFNIDKNKQYTLKCMVQQVTANNYSVGFNIIYEDDTSETCLHYNGEISRTTKKAIKDIRMTFYNHTIADITNIQIEEGTQATEYEPYQEYTKTIYLNSPLLKGDTIEVHNGKLCYYHKMGKVALDGSENWIVHDDTLEKTIRFYIPSYLPNTVKDDTRIINDTIVQSPLFFDNDREGSIITYPGGHFYIKINKSKLSTTDVNGFKQWLQANPTTVVYELASPYYEEISPLQEDLIITSVKEGDLHIDTIVPISSKVTYNVNVQLLTDFEQSIVEQVQATQTTDLQSILDEEIDN